MRTDILNPKAKKLLKNLEELNLISIKKDEETIFTELVDKLHNKNGPRPTSEEITQEVEAVRSKKHEAILIFRKELLEDFFKLYIVQSFKNTFQKLILIKFIDKNAEFMNVSSEVRL